MDKVICYICSKGIEIHPEGIVWAKLRLAIVDYKSFNEVTGIQYISIMQWFRCDTCGHEYFTTTHIQDEGVRKQ